MSTSDNREDTDMKIDYALVLKQIQEELSGMDARRQALLATMAGLKRLVGEEEQQQLFPQRTFGLADAPAPSANGNGKASTPVPTIPPGFFSGKSPTQGYRDLMKLWPGPYTPPQIADAFLAGGMTAPTRTHLVQSIHSVLKRDRKRKAREEATNGA